MLFRSSLSSGPPFSEETCVLYSVNMTAVNNTLLVNSKSTAHALKKNAHLQSFFYRAIRCNQPILVIPDTDPGLTSQPLTSRSMSAQRRVLILLYLFSAQMGMTPT